jgi:K+-sensing histidine kinase KdpD
MNFVDLAALTIHDVKNRLALLASRAESKGDSETLHDAMEAAATLTRLLVCYKAEKGSLGVEIDAHVPGDLLAELAAEMGKQTSLLVSVESSAAPTLWFYDENLVRMVLLNALYNALRHARQHITLSAASRDGQLELVVRDDGPGYPAEMLGQSPDVAPLSHQGTGLGLQLASQVAAWHRNAGQTGRVELSNDGGAVFALRLPQ